jgi:plastocyanin
MLAPATASIGIMTWLLRTCFSALLAVSLPGATVTGRVTLRDSRERARRSLSDYSGVVVWLERTTGASTQSTAHVKMLQRDKTFEPHVLAITVGTTVDFPNLDPIFHNAFSVYDGQLFDVGLYPPGKSRSIRFIRPGFVRVFCNIHSTMSAVIAVMDTPFFAVTRDDGRFEIPGVPEGAYQLEVFHERATEATLTALRRTINVRQERVELPDTVISETGYLAIPHKNKYGRDYTPPPDDGNVYPATRQ